MADEGKNLVASASTRKPVVRREAHVYCGNYTRLRGMFEEPDECNWEGDVPLTDDPEEDDLATWVCPGCSATNTVRDHLNQPPAYGKKN